VPLEPETEYCYPRIKSYYRTCDTRADWCISPWLITAYPCSHNLWVSVFAPIRNTLPGCLSKGICFHPPPSSFFEPVSWLSLSTGTSIVTREPSLAECRSNRQTEGNQPRHVLKTKKQAMHLLTFLQESNILTCPKPVLSWGLKVHESHEEGCATVLFWWHCTFVYKMNVYNFTNAYIMLPILYNTWFVSCCSTWLTLTTWFCFCM